MLYLAIDQHRKQLTVNLRNEAGDVILKRQVSTEWKRVRQFLEDIRQRSQPEGGFVAILEVCGFNDWLLKLLKEYGCRETILIQPEKRSKKKTDRRDANAAGRDPLGEPRAAAGGQEGPGDPPRAAAQRAGRGRPADHLDAQAFGNAPHADHQQDQAHPAETQPGAGVSHERDRHDQGEKVVGPIVPRPRSTGWRWTSS